MSTYPQYPGHEEERQRPHLVRRPERGPKRELWKRIAGWISLSVLILIVVTIVAILVLPHIRSFRQYTLRVAEQKVSAALGSQVKIGDFALSLSHLTLDLYSVTVNGSAPYPNPPVLTVDHMGLGLGLTSLLHREWYVKSVAVDHPVVHVFEDAHGTNNLPQTKKSNSQSNTDLFQLGVRHAVLDGGELYYNNRKSLLDADLRDLTFEVRFDPSQQQYSGNMSYRDGHLQVQDYRPMPHDLDAEFAATRQMFTLRRAVWRSGPSHVEVAATARNFADPQIHATYAALLDAGQFRQITRNPNLPRGIINAKGVLDYESKPNVPALASATLKGELTSRVLQLETPSIRGNVSDLLAHYSLTNGNAAADLHAGVLGGDVDGNLSMRDIAGKTQSRLRATVKNASLAQLRPMMKSAATQNVGLAGIANADAEARWGKTLDNLIASANATVQARITSREKANAQPLPVNGAVHARYLAASKQVSLTQSYLRTTNTTLNLNGTVSNHSSLEIRLLANDLHELETIAEEFRTPQPGQPPQQLGLYGTASFEGSVRGSTLAPQLTGQLQANNVRVRGSAWRMMRTNVSVSPSQASLQNGELQPADQGRITFNVSAGMNRWSFSKSSPIQVGLNASQLNVAELARLAGSQVPVAGTLSTNLSLSGSEENPIGQGTLSLTKARISSEPLQVVNMKFQGTGDEVHTNLTVQMPAGNAQAVLAFFPKRETYQAQVQALGIRLDQLQTVKAHNLQVVGVLNINADGQGSVNNPELVATIESPKLQVRDQILGDLRLQTNLANHIANIALDTHAVNTVVTARAQVNTTGDYETNAKIDTQRIPLQPLVALYSPAQAGNLSGQTELHATLRGPLKNKAALDAHAIIPVLQVNYANKVKIGATSPIRVDFTNGVLALQKTDIRGTDTNVQLQASVPTNSAQPMSLLALGTVNLQIAQLFDPDLSTSGEMRFDINSYGARANPDVLQGQIRIVNANFASGAAPIGLQNGNGVLTLTKDRLNITQFTGTVGGGKVQASGGVVYKPSLGFDLALAGQGVRLLYPDGLREGLDANLTLTGTTDAATLGGRVKIDQLSFTPDFDLTTFMSQFGGTSTAPPTPGFSQNLQLNLTVQSTSGINLASRELSLQGNANLNVRGTADQPVILGRVNLQSGDLIFMGNRYILQPGTIDFANAARTEPTVNVAANTTIQQYNIYLQFYGPADHLRTNYTSVPSLPPSDIINLLAFGKTSEASAANTTPGNLGAESLLASQVSSQVTSRVEKIAGISRLSVDPVLAGNGTRQNPGARITIQQRVTGNIFVTFAFDTTQTQGQVVQLQYNITPRVSFSGTRDQNGGFGFDTRIQKSW